MNRRQRASRISDILEELFPSPSIPLQHEDPFTLLIAVLLSAQCTDERVNKVTPFLFAKAKTPQAMASLSVEEISDIIRPCGLYRNKSMAIHSLSQILCDRFSGQVPADFANLESLPGVGHKTASVVLTQAFSIPTFPVDTHIHRCAKRWRLSSATHVRKTEEDLKALFPSHRWGKLHLQIIYFARKYCPARGHHPQDCPICKEMTR